MKPDFLRIGLTPPHEIEVESTVTISFSGRIDARVSSDIINGNPYSVCDVRKRICTDGYNRMVTNYGEFVTTSEEGDVSIGIQRCVGDDLGLNCGLMEELEFEVA